MPASQQHPRPLFVAGIPQRSGTTAFADYLNMHPQILLTIERYKYGPRPITPDLFTFERILDYREGETDGPRERHVRLLSRKDPERLKWIGDKRPAHHRRYEELLEHNPGAHFIVMYRSVEEIAVSFNARARRPGDSWWAESDEAVKRWNRALRLTHRFVAAKPNLLIVPYHAFFQQDPVCLEGIQRFLGVRFGQRLRKAWATKSAQHAGKERDHTPLTDEELAYVREQKNERLERWIERRIAAQYDGELTTSAASEDRAVSP